MRLLNLLLSNIKKIEMRTQCLFALVGIIVIMANPIYGSSLQEIDSLYDHKGELTDLQWEEARKNLIGTKIALTGTALNVETKGYIFFKNSIIYLRGEQDNIDFYATCNSSIKLGRSICKGSDYTIRGKIKKITHKGWGKLAVTAFFTPSLIWKSYKTYKKEPLMGYWFEIEDCKLVK